MELKEQIRALHAELAQFKQHMAEFATSNAAAATDAATMRSRAPRTASNYSTGGPAAGPHNTSMTLAARK
jgi:hypothetical protein